MNRRWIAVGAFLLAGGVIAGAFGAHALKARLDPGAMDVYETAVWYHFIHAGAICFIGLLAEVGVMSSERACNLATVFLLGIVFFSGSLYALAFSDVPVLGGITPLGGLLLISGWLCLGLSLWAQPRRPKDIDTQTQKVPIVRFDQLP